jgi:hypothetical protein
MVDEWSFLRPADPLIEQKAMSAVSNADTGQSRRSLHAI